MKLPQISYNMGKVRSEIVAMRGVNYSDRTQDGDLRESKNISARRYPFFSNRKARKQLEEYSGITALTAWEKLVAVSGTELLYDGVLVGQVTAGEKQFAVVNTKLVVWPDKVYLDIKSRELKPLGAAVSGKGAVFTANTMQVTGWDDLTKYFKAGDGISISGCVTVPGNNIEVVIRSVTEDTITVGENTFQAGTEANAVLALTRDIPDFDFICESGNRLWGCSNDQQTIYASSLGDPTNFFVYEGVSTDSYAVAVGTDGDFTGCCKHGSSVLFFKETKLHKVLGDFPAEYGVYTYEMEGLKRGCHKSLSVINEVLFYVGPHGVFAYTGGTPAMISENFGERRLESACAGNDGERYYLAAEDQTGSHLLVYETRSGIWLREDDAAVVDFARIGTDLYFLTEKGEVWLADSSEEDPEIEWLMQFTPFYETVIGKKSYTRLLFRVQMERGSYLNCDVRYDGGIWKNCGKIVGREHNTVTMRIPIYRCDRFEIRLHGKGPCTVLSVMREFMVRSDV